MIKSGIYKITNCITGDFYIGSSININKRFITHTNLLNNNLHVNRHLQNAYNKYGRENFKFEVIGICSKEDCIGLEQWFLDNLKPDYNICKVAGNSLGVIRSEETKKRISISARKRIDRFYYKTKKFSESISEGIKNSENFKYFLKTRNPEGLKGRSLSVIQYDKNMNFITIHPSAKQAAKNIDVKDYSAINKCCNDKRKSAYNFIWRFKN